MMTELLRASTNYARCFRRQRRCACRHIGLLRDHDQQTHNLVVQKPRLLVHPPNHPHATRQNRSPDASSIIRAPEPAAKSP
jgi:hypothetical protein